MSGRVCPGAYALANHTSLGLRGLWVGMLAGNGVVAVVYVLVVARLDWAAVASQARELVEVGGPGSVQEPWAEQGPLLNSE